MKLQSCLLAGVFLLAGSPAAQGAALSTFAANSEGWTTLRFADTGFPDFNSIGGTDAPIHSAAGGNPGGRISIQDPTAGWQYFSAPAAFLGDQSGALGQNLTFDMIRLDANFIAALAPQGPLVAATNGTTVLVYSGAFSVPVTSGWTNYSVALSAGNWRVNTPLGAVATAGQLSAVFGNLTGLYLDADFFAGAAAAGQGVPETIGLDNVNLPGSTSSVPEPSSLALVGLSVAVLGVRARRK